jgi:hypothetical protein
MFWGCISSQRKGPLVVFEKDWGKVTGKVYRDNVVPLIHQFKRGIDFPILMEDGASVHTAKATHAFLITVTQYAFSMSTPDVSKIR